MPNGHGRTYNEYDIDEMLKPIYAKNKQLRDRNKALKEKIKTAYSDGFENGLIAKDTKSEYLAKMHQIIKSAKEVREVYSGANLRNPRDTAMRKLFRELKELENLNSKRAA